MKQRRLISAALVIVMVFALYPAGDPALASAVPSAWAVPEINDANTSGLLTPGAARDYHRALTRDEFCELVVGMIERTLGRELPIPAENPFSDSTSIPVQKAYQYGVINGIGGGLFAPNNLVERQQLCTMMVRAILNLERDTAKTYLEQPVAVLPFNDSGNIADYAIDPVKRAYASEIMYGDTSNNFNPASNITSQECIAVITRSYNSMQKTLAEGRTEAQLVDMAYNRLSIGFAYGDSENGVTRNLLLPDTGTGGSEITWRSSNESVISSAGVVTAGATPVTVTLTASINLGETTRDKAFTLTTSPYSGDRLVVENAINALEIIYLKEGDGPNSVTGRICLPNSLMGVPIIWSSSNSSTITPAGLVILPQGSDVRTVTLTATVTSGSSTRTKSFELKVNNPAYTSRSVTLFGVGLGMTQAQIAQVLGSPKNRISASASETWNVYHDNYKNFVAVGFIGNSSVAVYSSDANAANQLKDASQTVLTVAQANGAINVGASAYTDPGNANRDYAIMLYTPNTVVGTVRNLYSEGQEQLLFELVNAFRVRNNLTALEYNSKLASASRTHSTEMGNYNYLSLTSLGGSSPVDRASLLGYETKLATGFNVLGGAADAFEFFDNMVKTTDMRKDIATANNTVFGAGFVGGYNGQYRNYLTYMFGTLRAMSGVTPNPASPKVDVGKNINVTVTALPSGCNESFTARSSNNAVMTVTLNANRVTATGVAAGSAYIVVTGVTSGKSYSIPVSVGAVLATDLTLNLDKTAVSNKTANGTLIMGMGDTLQITPVTTPAVGPAVSWSIDKTNIATVNSSGVVTAKAIGSATVTARVNNTTGGIEERKVTIHVGTLSIDAEPKPGTFESVAYGSTRYIDRNGTLDVKLSTAFADTQTITYGWSSSNTNVATVAPLSGTTDKFTITAKATGTAVITVTATRPATALNSGTITKTFTIDITESKFATSLSLSEKSPLELEIGQTIQITATTNPVAVENRTVFWLSSDTKIATVNQTGLITARAEGMTIISATIPAESGNPITETLVLNVTKRTTPLKSLSINGVDTAKVDDEKPYTAVYNPSNTTQTDVSWDVIINNVTYTNKGVARKDNPNIYDIKFDIAGVWIIRVWLKDDPSIIAVKSVNVTPKT